LTGIQPIRFTNQYSFLIHWGLYFTLIMLANHALGRGYFRYYAIEKYNILKMFTFIKATFSLFTKKPLQFRVTPKSTDRSVLTVDRRELLEHTALLCIMLFSIIWGCVRMVWKPFVFYDKEIFYIALFWAMFNIFLLCAALRDINGRRYQRNAYRFPVRLDSRIYDTAGSEYHAVTADISSTGIGIILSCFNTSAQIERISLCVPDGVIELKCSVSNEGDCIDGEQRIGVRFCDMPSEERKKLLTLLYVTMPRLLYEDKGNHTSAA
jgi:cellulose synthase (UDP-forming)